MAGDSSQNSFRRGIMSLVILTLLKREDMYGYQLVQETSKSSGGRITNCKNVRGSSYFNPSGKSTTVP